MAVTIKHRRYQTTVTVDNKLGAALVKHGTHEYAAPSRPSAPALASSPAPVSATPVAATAAAAVKPAVAKSGEKATKTHGKAGGKTKPAAKGKRAYNRRDMQAKD